MTGFSLRAQAFSAPRESGGAFLTLLLAIVPMACSAKALPAQAALTSAQMRADLSQLAACLQAKHPGLYRYATKQAFEEQLASVTQSVAGTTMNAEAARSALADDAGRFELRNVPHRIAYLRVDGEGILPVEFGRSQQGGLVSLLDATSNGVLIVAKERLHVQVALANPGLADSLQVLDGQDQPVVLNVFKGRSRHESRTIALPGGRSPVFVSPDDGVTLRLLLQGEEVQRQSLVLQAGTVNRIQL